MTKSKSTIISGTKEWSVASVNILKGCSHDCRYCYAREMGVRRGYIVSNAAWSKPVLRVKELGKKRVKFNGPVMFPTTHDILPEFLDECTATIVALLEAGNRVLLVSKPHLECVRHLCRNLDRFRSMVMWRFTIGAMSDDILGYWEPGAPTFSERISCLQLAHRAGYQTSISAEPLLEPERVVTLYSRLSPWVTHSFWIGKLNGAHYRLPRDTSRQEISRIMAEQTDDAIRATYSALKDRPLVRWKESYKAVLGLDLATVAGADR